MLQTSLLRMEALLDAADVAGSALSFVVVVPKWTMPRGPQLPAWRSLSESRRATCQLTLPKGKHAFVDGVQQHSRRPAALPITPSRHDSSIFVLQSARAAKRSPLTEPMQERLRRAFAVPPGPEQCQPSSVE